jgi:hypothetical protein
MKKVNCENCQHFAPDQFNEDEERTFKAFCLLGKRIMFRKQTETNWMYEDEWGYVRKCDTFSRRVEE